MPTGFLSIIIYCVCMYVCGGAGGGEGSETELAADSQFAPLIMWVSLKASSR